MFKLVIVCNISSGYNCMLCVCVFVVVKIIKYYIIACMLITSTQRMYIAMHIVTEYLVCNET